jgi:hypothetical protein
MSASAVTIKKDHQVVALIGKKFENVRPNDISG